MLLLIEDSKLSNQELGAMLVIGGLGMCGNGLVLAVLLRTKSIRQRLSSILVVNQALVDFITSLLFIATFTSRYFKKGYGGYRQLICFLIDNEYLEWNFLQFSSINLMMITLERYIMVVHPIFYRTKIKKKHVYIAIIVSFIISTTYWTCFILPFSAVINDFCFPQIFPTKTVGAIFTVTYFIIYFVCPVCVFLFCYCHMVWILRQKRKIKSNNQDYHLKSMDHLTNKKMSKTEINLTKVMVIVSCFFTICWGPVSVMYLLQPFDIVSDAVMKNYQFYYAIVYLCFLNSCINPFIYAFKYEEFKTGLKEMVTLSRATSSTVPGSSENS